MKDDVAKRLRAFIRRGIRRGAIEAGGYLDLHGNGVYAAMSRLGEAVLTLGWSTDSPVERRGSEVVYRLGGKYFRSLSAPARWAGPFTRLVDAMGGAVQVGRATDSVTCTEWSDTELIAHMQLLDPPPLLRINGTEWSLADLERVYEDKTRDPRVRRVIFPVSPSVSGGKDAAPEPPAPADAPSVILGTARQAPNGRALICTSGPPDPLGMRTDALRRADGLLRTGMVAVAKCEPPQLARAERCFREALDLLTDAWQEPHPRISYALDRLGLVRHLQDDLEGAESLYLRSLKVLGPSDRPTPWNDATLLNLARLYRRQGRGLEAEAVMAYFRGDDAAEETR